MHTLKADAVTVAYKGGARALRQFELEFSGDCLAVVGLEADGKTTLINALAGLVSYDGDITLDGKPLPRVPKGDTVQAVLEDYCLFNSKTVRENVAFPLKIRKQYDADKVNAVIDEYGLSKYADTKIKKLGENVKPYVAVARLSLVSRDLYLFDDVLKPLHDEDKPVFLKKLSQLFKRLDGMKIYATSDIEEAKMLSDKIVVLYGGVIEQYGDYYELWHSPSSVRVAEIMSKGAVKFNNCILREMNGRLSVNIAGTAVYLQENSIARLIDRSYVGTQVQAAEYAVGNEVKYLIMDAETDKTILLDD